MSEFIRSILQPLLEEEYKKGFSAVENAEKLVKEKEWADRE